MIESKLLFDENMDTPIAYEYEDSKVVVFSRKCKLSKVNQDSIGIIADGKKSKILCLADGAGGHKSGAEASKLVIEKVEKYLNKSISPRQRRLEIIEAIEKSNDDIMGAYPGAATTLVIAEVSRDMTRVYFAGDSICLVIGGRGKLKYRTYGHNPVDLGIQAGILSEDDYDEHGMRHYVTNILGSKQLHIECSVAINLDPQDTVLICSDGLYDNIKIEEICEFVGGKNIDDAAESLYRLAKTRMSSEQQDYSKYDDLSFVLYQKKIRPISFKAGS